LDRDVAFVGIDEIQMCADPDRGHIFTDRLLHARGRDETMFMGAETIRPLLSRLLPEAEIVTRPRFSTLIHTGPKKVTRLPARSAAVAFSAANVYAMAELIRRQRGGAAVVLGALSPRTRNAQVAMYQAGDVDYLVATDAIGMGLNMDVDHVAFAAAKKFDGRRHRPLTAPELAQTAGRAGRHMNDGTFGTTNNVKPLDPELAARIENHEFEPLAAVFWRNPALDFSSLDGLLRSLAMAPQSPGLTKAREADDETALRHLAEESDVAAMAASSHGLHRLWDVCRIPDFGQVMSDAHARLLGVIYKHLMGSDGKLPADWLAAQVARLDNPDGDIVALASRIAAIRTWTYVSYQADWLADAAHWQDRTRAIEDTLSDVLHQRLTQRFVDKRTALLVSRIKDRVGLLAAVKADGDVTVEGHFVGCLDGFRFLPDEGNEGDAAKSVMAAAALALRGEIASRADRLAQDGDKNFCLSPDAGGWPRRIGWRGADVGRIKASRDLSGDVLRLNAQVLSGGLLETPDREKIRVRLQAWLDGHIRQILGPLFEARAIDMAGPVRGIVFQLGENLGSLDRKALGAQIDALDKAGRKTLRDIGVRIGRHAVFYPSLLKPAAQSLRGLLWVVHAGAEGLAPLPQGRVSLKIVGDCPAAFYEAQGFAVFGALALRLDMVERLAAKAWALSAKGPFALTADGALELMSLAGSGPDDMAVILKGLGYKIKGPRFERRRAKRPAPPKKTKSPAKDSPFAKLQDMRAR
ncbi:MAG: disulfide oxidoreductase, partial [Rhodospirillales bacterium]|nr:disulfide oxidoreductase [Rhodospirillales bacterium]